MDDPQRAKAVQSAYAQYHQWIEEQPGVNGCSLGIDDRDRDVIRVLTDPACHEELSQRIRRKVGDYVHFIPANPKAFG